MNLKPEKVLRCFSAIEKEFLRLHGPGQVCDKSDFKGIKLQIDVLSMADSAWEFIINLPENKVKSKVKPDPKPSHTINASRIFIVQLVFTLQLFKNFKDFDYSKAAAHVAVRPSVLDTVKPDNNYNNNNNFLQDLND